MDALRARAEPNEPEDESLLTTSSEWSSELPLSPRECEIARLVASDLTNKEIARVLEISEWTVSTHLRRIFSKLRVHSKAAMVARVLDTVAMAERRRAGLMRHKSLRLPVEGPPRRMRHR